RGIHRPHPHIRAEAADAGLDRITCLGVDADDARQAEQRNRLLQGQAVAVHALGKRRAARLALLLALAELHVQAVRAAADGDLLAGVGMEAERAHPLLQRLGVAVAGLDREAARVLARRVVRAADEAAVAAQLQAQPASAAGRTETRVAAVLAGG